MDLDIALMLGERISSFIEKIVSGYYGDGMIKQSLASFEGLLSAMKKYHKRRSLLPHLVARIMEILMADKDKKMLAFYTSLLYDLGLMVIDQCIINKEKIFVADARILKTHPHATIALLDGFEISEDARMAVLHHHESFDGTGYPDQLKGEEIPIFSRVLSVADSFCAMIEDRPYRKAFTRQQALQEIEKHAGSMYDAGSHIPMPTSLLPVFHDGILFERMGDILTDTFRANILRIMGYRTDVTQFVPIEHTAKNLMIRSVKTSPAGNTRWMEEYKNLKSFWQVTPYLEKLLSDSQTQYLK